DWRISAVLPRRINKSSVINDDYGNYLIRTTKTGSCCGFCNASRRSVAFSDRGEQRSTCWTLRVFLPLLDMDGNRSDGHSYVLRKKPPGRLLPGAHKVDREYTVQKALFSAGFPVPQPLLYCSDAEIIGTEFYVMEHAEGRIFRDMRLPGVSAAERTALYVCAAETLAKLHSIDLATLGLVGYGKGAGYCKRQARGQTNCLHISWIKKLDLVEHAAVLLPDLFLLYRHNGTYIFCSAFNEHASKYTIQSNCCLFQEVFDYYTKHEHSPQRWVTPPIIEDLKVKARAAGLWNLFLPAVSGLSQLDYAHIAEETGCCVFAPDVFNCQAPDTGNMEVLHMFGSEEQKRVWLEPLLRGDIKSCFCMTEPDVASSDATNMECSLEKDGDHYIITGRKWWSSGKCVCVCMVFPCFRHGQHSMILVPMDMPGVKRIRPLTVFGQDDAVHGGHLEIAFENVRVPASNIILGEGRGFEIAQGRLGPGRLHHCMRAVGLAETALQLLCQRAAKRQAFGKKLYQHEVVAHWIAECRISIEQTRLLTLSAAHALDTQGNKVARKQIAMIKVAAGRMACKVVDCSIQVHGGAGLSSDFPLAHMYSYARSLRLADGPDEVHLSSIAGMELRDQLKRARARL
uniref:Acyl-CoA dehydrogenase family member 11 n=1 Tax=Denticeps clupeoides TaxID=299321 RepID=A0AAY4DR70_9TELE